MSNTPKTIWLSIKQIAEQLGVHPATVRRQAKKKNVPIAKIGTAHRIREEHVKLLMTVEAN
jgi:excisionase family DNA binding protein